MKKTTVVFDLDGTLLDTLQDLANAVNYALEKQGMPKRTLEEVRQFVGNGVRLLMIRAVPDGERNPLFEETFALFKEYYGKHCNDNTKPYAGVVELIETLKEKGYAVAIVSNKIDFAVKELNDLYFKGIVPVAIGVALKCLGSAPACYMILAMLADVIDHIEYKFGIRTDGLTMSIYSSIMVAATPVCNSIFSAILNASGYDQAADIALGTAAQTAAAQTAISVGYIWVETIAYVICAILIFFFTIEKDLPEEQKAIAARKNNK